VKQQVVRGKINPEWKNKTKWQPTQQAKHNQKALGRTSKMHAKPGAHTDLSPGIEVHVWVPVDVELVLDAAQPPDASQRVGERAHILLEPLV
jgi:hypothetical protein